MSDDSSKRGPQDRKRINTEQEHEIKYWTQRLGVSREQLQELIRAAGPTVDALEAAVDRLKQRQARTANLGHGS